VARKPIKSSIARKLVAEFPDVPTQTLARRLLKENIEHFTDLDDARASVRYVRGNFGSKMRQYADPKLKRANGKAGWKPECPPSLAEPWGPFVLEKCERVLSLSDIHVPFHDPKALTIALSYARDELDPDVVLINGDGADFYSVSRHDKNPTRVGGLKAELEALREVLQWIMSAFPQARFVYKLGNHEERLEKHIWNKAPELLGVAPCRMWESVQLNDLKIEWVADKRPIMAGHLPILHGHEFAKGLAAPVNPARSAFLKLLHTALIGHLHRASTHPEPDMFGSETTCWSQGCLCDLHPEYAPFNKWQHGFAFVEVHADGEFDLHNYKLAKGGRVRTV
jgi:hypothetical protein